MAEDLIRDLKQQIATKRAVIIVGSGVSIGATGNAVVASWKGLIEHGLRRVHGLGIKDQAWLDGQLNQLATGDLDDLLGVAEQVANRLGYPSEGTWKSWLRDSFEGLTASDRSVLQALAEVGAPLATTNYDNLLEEVTGLPPVTWRDSDRALRVLRGEERAILHLHGHWNDWPSVVLGIRGYEQVKLHGLAQTIQKLLAGIHNLVFVGCGTGLADPNIGALLGWVAAHLGGAEHRHFRLVWKGELEDVEAEKMRRHNLFPLEYGADHGDLAPFLRTLIDPTPAMPIVPPSAPNLPGRGRFIGRDIERKTLVAAILDDDRRPIAILGPPGIGKSTLTRQALHDSGIASRFGERRWFVRLDAAHEERLLWVAILAAVGVTTPGPNPSNQALTLLGERPGLLVLDNLETPWHSDTVAVEESLASLADVEGLRVVASIRGTVWPARINWREPSTLEPLSFEQSRELFLGIAGGALAPDPDLEAIVSALDGLPLAIELVARRAQGSGSLAPVLAEFRSRKAELFEAGEGKDLSLRASLALSLNSPRMTGPAKRLFTVLGRLPAGIAETELNKLLPPDGRSGGRVLIQLGLAYDELGRVRTLAPIREHAATRPLHDVGRLLSHYLGMAQRLGSKIGRAGGAEAVARLSPEMANLATAVDLALMHGGTNQALAAQHGLAQLMRFTGSGSSSCLGRLANAARRVGNFRGQANCISSLGDIAQARSDHSEARERFDAALGLYRQVGSVQGEANCIKSLGDIAQARSDHDGARGRYDAALRLYRQVGDVQGEANCIRSLGDIARARSDHGEARERFDAALGLYRQVGNVQGEANCIRSLGDIAQARSDHGEARERFETALGLYRQVGNVLGEANCISSLGDIAQARSDHGEARERFETALGLYRQVGDVLGEANCIKSLGDIAQARSDHDGARGRYDAALRLYRQVGDVLGEANCIKSLGDIAQARSDHGEARERFDAALRLYRQVGDVLGEANCIRSLGDIARARSDHSEARERFDAALRLYRQVGSVQGEANCILQFGEIERERSQYSEARARFNEALKALRKIGDVAGEACCLLGLGAIARTLGEPTAGEQLERALRLFTDIEQLEGRGKTLLELAQLEIDLGGPSGPQLLLDALDSHTRFGNPRWIGETHRRLARISVGEEREEHARLARDAWASIDRPDLMTKLEEEFGSV